MGYNIKKNWAGSLDIIRKHPVILLPFIFGAFFEALALELIYFSTRRPLSLFFNPIINKFFGAGYLHYPGNIMMMPKLFYYAQVVVYIFTGVFIMGIAVNIFKNVREGLPLKAGALIKNGLRRYGAYLTFGIIMVVLLMLIRNIDTFLYLKCMKLLTKFMPALAKNISYFGMTLLLFFSNVILQLFFLLTVPIMVIQKKPLIKAVGGSIYLGFHNFLTIFFIIFVPFMAYLPISLLKGGSLKLISKTFPEIVIIITGFGIIATMLMDCFIAVCMAQFLMDKQGEDKNKVTVQ